MRTRTSVIETIIVLVIMLIAGFIVHAAVINGGANYTVGLNGITENRCINGYMFVVGERGQARQMVDSEGKGIRCE